MDPRLYLKPIELIDIGIDKLTKIPVPILNENMVSTFDMEYGLPSDSFILTFNANYGNFSITLISDYDVQLLFNYGDSNIENLLITSSGRSISHNYTSAITYTITITGWLEKIKTLIVLPSGSTTGGLTSATLTRLKNLSKLDLTNNRLISLDLSGLVYLNNIILDNNYFPNDVIDDLYIEADTFLSYRGNLSSIGTNNGKPSIYSINSRNSLKDKEWILKYNS